MATKPFFRVGYLACACIISALTWQHSVSYAAYEPNVDVNDYPKEDVKKGMQAMRLLTKNAREAVIAEKMALLFLLSGESAYGEERHSSEHGTKYFEVKPEAKFMSSSGKMLDFNQELNTFRKKKFTNNTGWDIWVQAKQGICAVGEDVIFTAFANDVTKITQQTAKRHLKAVPAKLREAWLAQWGGMLFMPDGSDAYDTPEPMKKYATFSAKREFAMNKRKPGAKFIDTEGKEQDADAVWAMHTKSERNLKIMFSASWCAGIIGADDILALFPKEVKALRANHSKRAGEAAAAQE